MIAFVAKNSSISKASEFVLVKQHGGNVVICKYKSENPMYFAWILIDFSLTKVYLC